MVLCAEEHRSEKYLISIILKRHFWSLTRPYNPFEVKVEVEVCHKECIE